MIRRADHYGAPNTIDQLKLIAIVTMFIDHLGSFLFPDLVWLRVIGRASFPIWLFIVGYHAAGQAPGDWKKLRRGMPLLLIGTLLIVAMNYIIAKPIMPFSILATILCARILLVVPTIRNAIEKQPLTVLVYAFIALPSFLAIEYGSLGLMFAMLGYLVRKAIYEEAVYITGFVAIVCYAVMSNMTFPFTNLQEYCVTGIVFAVVYYMAQRTLKPWALKPALVKPVCLLTRNSYYFYIIHVLLLKMLGTLILPPKAFFVLKFFS